MDYLGEPNEITFFIRRKQERTHDDKVEKRKAEVWRWIKESQAKDWRGLLEFEDVREVTTRASRIGQTCGKFDLIKGLQTSAL